MDHRLLFDYFFLFLIEVLSPSIFPHDSSGVLTMYIHSIVCNEVSISMSDNDFVLFDLILFERCFETFVYLGGPRLCS